VSWASGQDLSVTETLPRGLVGLAAESEFLHPRTAGVPIRCLSADYDGASGCLSLTAESTHRGLSPQAAIAVLAEIRIYRDLLAAITGTFRSAGSWQVGRGIEFGNSRACLVGRLRFEAGCCPTGSRRGSLQTMDVDRSVLLRHRSRDIDEEPHKEKQEPKEASAS